MIDRQAAIAVFVKTPGQSPVKTRLATGIGRMAAEEFYRLSVAAVERAVTSLAASADIAVYWAVAEETGLNDLRWRRFPRVFQGPGNLGDRLNHVFESVQERHPTVLAIGADSPQITPRLIRSALDCLSSKQGSCAHVLGRCYDGGFYLVGTKAEVPRRAWLEVSYSTSETAERLADQLAALGAIEELPSLTDVDQVEDLSRLYDELGEVSEPSREQLALMDWIASWQGPPLQMPTTKRSK